jgi:hypothetical protein
MFSKVLNAQGSDTTNADSSNVDGYNQKFIPENNRNNRASNPMV